MEFVDFVNTGIELVKDIEGNTWELCRLAYEFKVEFDCKQGRPSKDEEEKPTFADLAGEWQVKTSTVSDWAAMGEYWGNVRPSEDLSYTHYRMAKRKAGKDKEKALAYVQHAEDNYLYKPQQFRRFLEGIYWEGELTISDIPAHIVGILPRQCDRVWAVFSKVKDGED